MKTIDTETLKVGPPPATAKVGKYRGSIVSTPRNLSRDVAYQAGIWAAANMGIKLAAERAKDMFQAIHSEGTDFQGGYLMNEEINDALIIVRERYGIFRKYARVVPMARASKRIGRWFSGTTAFAIGENSVGTEKTLAVNDIRLDAKKFMVLTRMSSELDEDGIVAFGDAVIGDIGYAFSVIEDKAGFIGDGSSTYAGIAGIGTALAAGAISTCAAANSWASISGAEINTMMSLALDEMRDPAFYCNRAFFDQVLCRIALANGAIFGMSPTGQPMWNFYPVRFTAAMPASSAASQICCYFGDLELAATLGDRRAVKIQRSTQADMGGASLQGAFERDEIFIKGTERIDIVINEIGTSTAGGAIVALKTHA